MTATETRQARRSFQYANELSLLAILVAAWLALGAAYPNFATVDNVQNVLFSVSMIAIVGVGMTMVILTGGIDVSVGSGLAVCTVIVAKHVLDGGSVLTALLLGVATGALLGAVNGVLVAYGRIAPIITTFATLNLFRFVSLEIFDNKQVNGIPVDAGVVRHQRPHVRHPQRVPRRAGPYRRGRVVPARLRHRPASVRHRVEPRHRAVRGRPGGPPGATVYLVTGALTGLAALVAVGSGGVAQPNAGTGFELQVIAAVVIGGTSILGGRGSVLTTLLGAVLVGTLRSALVTMGAPGLLSDFFLGVFILVAVAVDLLRKKRRRDQ